MTKTKIVKAKKEKKYEEGTVCLQCMRGYFVMDLLTHRMFCTQSGRDAGQCIMTNRYSRTFMR